MLFRNTNIFAIAALLAFLGLGSSAKATLLVHEGFDYAPGVYTLPADAAVLTGGTGFSAGWYDHFGGALDFRITGGGSAGTYLDGAGGMTQSHGYWRGRNYNVGDQSAGTVIWGSVLMSDGGNTVGGVIFNSTGGGEQVRIQIEADNTYSVKGGHSAPVFDNSGALTASQDADNMDLIVIKFLNTATDGEQTASIWINPTATSEAGLASPDMTVTYMSFADNRNFGMFTLAPGTTRIDDLMVGTTYESVSAIIPEPSSLAILGLGCALLPWLKHRRRSN